MSKVTLPAQFTSMKSLKDRTWNLTFGTPELSGEDATVLTGLLMDEVYLLISSDGKFEGKDIPEVKPDASAVNKTPSQRLRSVMHILYEQDGSKGSWEAYYLSQMERLIELFKDRIDAKES